MTLEEAYNHFLPYWKDIKNINAHYELRILLCHILQITPLQFSLLNFKSFTLKNAQLAALQAYVQQRSLGKPLAYIVNYKYFWQDKFYVNEDVLIPRPETETLIEELLKLYINKCEAYNILDIGVGSGCLLLSILQEYPNSRGVGVDISAPACEVAKININLLTKKYLQNKLKIKDKEQNQQQSICKALSQRVSIINIAAEVFTSPEKFDIIVSNPPYIDVNEPAISFSVKNFEPAVALFAKNDGLYYYDLIFKKCTQLLVKQGYLLLEIGYKQKNAVKQLAEKHGLYCYKVGKDLANHDRVLVFRQN